jgi:hypothetical protein
VVDPELLAGLEEAVEAVPENRALHYHVISVLLDGGLPDRALGHAQWLLLHEPDNCEALLFAADASEAAGYRQRADRYRRVAQALAADV